MTITTEDAEAFARQLENNDPGVSDPVAIEFFGDVATALRALAAERDQLRRSLSDAQRAQGVAEGKLAASEMSGVVEGWKARAERAEAALAETREVLASVEVGSLPDDFPTVEIAKIRVETLNSRTLEGLAAIGRAERAEAEAERLRNAVTAAIIAYEHDIAQGVEPSEDRRRVIAVLRAALEGGDDADQQT